MSIIQQLQANPLIRRIYPDVWLPVHQGDPLDPLAPYQWHLGAISAQQAWDLSKGDPVINVAIIDGGADYAHEDLYKTNADFLGYDFVGNDYDPFPDDTAKHATSVAGLIAASTNDSVGVAGVAGGWSGGGVRLMYFRAGGRSPINEFISTLYATCAVDSAIDHGARIINMSFGDPTIDHEPLKEALDSASLVHNVVCIASAGNYGSLDGDKRINYPARYSTVIAVGAVDTADYRKEWSTYSHWGSALGPELDLVAPGVSIWTTDLVDSLGYSPISYTQGTFGGTSAAAPTVAGVCALVLSLNNNLTPIQVQNTLQLSADKVAGMQDSMFHTEYGYGRVNAYKAVRNIYVPTVQPIIDSGFQVIRPGQAILLEPYSGSHIIHVPSTLPAFTTLEIHAGDTLVVGDSLTVDSTAVVWLYSEPGAPAVIRFTDSAALFLNHPLSLRGTGIIDSANIRWLGDFQISAKDTLTFRNGASFGSTTDRSKINVNGSLIFENGTFTFAIGSPASQTPGVPCI